MFYNQKRVFYNNKKRQKCIWKLTGIGYVTMLSSSSRTLQSISLLLFRGEVGGLVGALMTADAGFIKRLADQSACTPQEDIVTQCKKCLNPWNCFRKLRTGDIQISQKQTTSPIFQRHRNEYSRVLIGAYSACWNERNQTELDEAFQLDHWS